MDSFERISYLRKYLSENYSKGMTVVFKDPDSSISEIRDGIEAIIIQTSPNTASEVLIEYSLKGRVVRTDIQKYLLKPISKDVLM